MPDKANEPRRHKIPRARYRVANWAAYDAALRRRGDLTLWVTPEAIAAWTPPTTGRRGRPARYSDLAIEAGLMLRLAFGRPWRQTEGLLGVVNLTNQGRNEDEQPRCWVVGQLTWARPVTSRQAASARARAGRYSEAEIRWRRSWK